MRACVSVRACVCVCTRVCARARGCTCVLNFTHVFAGVCQWRKPGQASGGENVRVRCLRICFIFIVILNVPSSAHVSKEHFHLYALYSDE